MLETVTVSPDPTEFPEGEEYQFTVELFVFCPFGQEILRVTGTEPPQIKFPLTEIVCANENSAKNRNIKIIKFRC
jgi:hypothetical protein